MTKEIKKKDALTVLVTETIVNEQDISKATLLKQKEMYTEALVEIDSMLSLLE